MNLIQILNAAKEKVKQLDAARMALADDAGDEVFAAANAAYFAAIRASAAAYTAYQQSIATPEMLLAQAEQREVNAAQLRASERLLALDRRTLAIRPTQVQLDAQDGE